MVKESMVEQFEVWASYKEKELDSIDRIKAKPHYYDALKRAAGHFREDGYPRWVASNLWWHLPKRSIDVLIESSANFSTIHAFQAVMKVKEFPIEGVMMEKRSLMPSSEGCMVRQERYHTIERDWHSEGNAVILFSLGEGEACERHVLTDGQEAMRVLEEYKETGKITLKKWHRVEEVTFSPVYVSVLKEYASYHKVEHVRTVDTTANDGTLEDKEGAGKECDSG